MAPVQPYRSPFVLLLKELKDSPRGNYKFKRVELREPELRGKAYRFAFVAQLIGHFKLDHQVVMPPRRQGRLRRSVLRDMARLALPRIAVLGPIEKLLGPADRPPTTPLKDRAGRMNFLSLMTLRLERREWLRL